MNNLDKHDPVKSYNFRSHYNQHWFNDKLRVMKKSKTFLEISLKTRN